MESVESKFLRYVSYDTTSDYDSESTPTTEKQKVLQEVLCKELNELGLKVTYDKYFRVYGYLKGNTKKKNTVGFCSHIDTSPDASGTNVKPRIIKNYDGKKIILDEKTDIDPIDFPFLSYLKGDDIITTDGKTLLGADDKAGVAIIMAMLEYYKENPEVLHGDIKVAFTPDEEVGHGADHFDVNLFKSNYAYTLDGGQINYIEYETFNAADAHLTFNGKSIHPGTSKNKMINSIDVAIQFDKLLDQEKKPSYTEGYEGFNHLTTITGNVEKTKVRYIIRNHDKEKFNRQKQDFKDAADFLNHKYGYEVVTLKVEDNYYNMYEVLKDHMDVVELAKKAISSVGLVPDSIPVRGGTDGCRISFLGIPCPNIGTGGYNYHGNKELVSINQMTKAVDIIKKIVELTV